jgi:hypothetical protein
MSGPKWAHRFVIAVRPVVEDSSCELPASRNAVVHLAVNPPVLPMLAKPVHALLDGGLQSEPCRDARKP